MGRAVSHDNKISRNLRACNDRYPSASYRQGGRRPLPAPERNASWHLRCIRLGYDRRCRPGYRAPRTPRDGRGNTVATNTISANGNILNITVTGTYTVNSDCTASLAESDGTHYKFVVVPDGNTASWIEIDPGTVVTGSKARMKARDGEDED